jgi:hypothetical protein
MEVMFRKPRHFSCAVNILSKSAHPHWGAFEVLAKRRAYQRGLAWWPDTRVVKRLGHVRCPGGEFKVGWGVLAVCSRDQRR